MINGSLRVKAHSNIIKYCLVIGILLLVALVFSPLNTIAQGGGGGNGGVGSGGSGGGGSGTAGACTGGSGGHWTKCGWGWTIYNIEAGQAGRSGPTDGFRDGTSWSSVLGTCDAANTKKVYLFIINDGDFTGMGYDFKTEMETPYQYSKRFSEGEIVDQGRATAITTATAKANFDKISGDPYWVDTSHVDWGDDVSWFCFDKQDPDVEIQTHGMVVDQDGNVLREMPITFTTSGHSSGQYGSSDPNRTGYRYFKVPQGGLFSITNVTAGASTSGLSGPFIRPYGSSGATADNYLDCPNGPYRGNPSIGQNNSSPGWCSGKTYKAYYCQYAGVHKTSGLSSPCQSGHDRNRDGGYDFVWVENTLPPTCSPSTQTVFVNSNATLTASSGNGSYSWSTSGSNNNSGTGSSFTRRWSSSGNKTVTVTSNGRSASCTVVVQNVPTCSPSTQDRRLGERARIDASGGNGTYSWSAPGASPSSGSGSRFEPTYNSYGNHAVTVTSNGRSATCRVNVQPPQCDGIRNNNTSISGFPDAVRTTLYNGTTVPGKSGYSTSPNQTHNEYKRDGIVVNRIEDTSPGGVHEIPIPYNNFLQTSKTSNATVDLDYRPFIEKCPYDSNRATVHYTYNYKRQNWRTTSSPSTYDCPNGGSVSGSYCYKSTSSYCPRYGSPPNCYGTRNTQNKYRPPGGSCSVGNVGSYCGQEVTYSNPQSPIYYCSGSGWTKISDSTCRRSARPLYAWYKNGGEVSGSENKSRDGATMEPCERRTYTAESVASTANLDSDLENPSNSRVTGLIRVDFGVKDASSWPGKNTLRRATSVTLPYRFQYKVGSGSWTNSASGSQTITATRNRVSNNRDSSTVTANVSVNVPNNLLPGDLVQWRLITGGSSPNNQVNGTADNAGVVMSSNSGTDTDSRNTSRVENWPYIKVAGGDIATGGDFGVCSPAGSRGVNSVYRSGSFGTSAQYGIFSVGSSIRGASSAGLKQGYSDPAPIKGLSFANTGGTFGGNLSGGSGTGCLPDYYANANDSHVVPLSSAGNAISRGNRIRSQLTTPTVSPDPSQVDFYRMNGDVIIRGGAAGGINVQDNTKKVFYVNGTVWIERNIVHSDGWNDRADIPFTAIIARNVVIDRDVTRLDGLFVAQPGGSVANSGNIWTCDVTNTNSIWSSCSNPLNVRGAFVAENVHFMRSHGSLRDSVANEGRSNADPAGNGAWNSRCGTRSGFAPNNNGSSGGTNCAAEVITYSPSLLMSISLLLNPGSNFTYDSFVVSAPNL